VNLVGRVRRWFWMHNPLLDGDERRARQVKAAANDEARAYMRAVRLAEPGRPFRATPTRRKRHISFGELPPEDDERPAVPVSFDCSVQSGRQRPVDFVVIRGPDNRPVLIPRDLTARAPSSRR
jgi:hypothetical protein